MFRLLTSTVGDCTVVRGWPKIVNKVIATVLYVYVKEFPATVIRVKRVDACLANHISLFCCWMASVQPHWSMGPTKVLWYHPLWHFPPSKACEAIPSPLQTAITNCRFSLLPNTLRTAARINDFFVSRITATGITNWHLES